LAWAGVFARAADARLHQLRECAMIIIEIEPRRPGRLLFRDLPPKNCRNCSHH